MPKHCKHSVIGLEQPELHGPRNVTNKVNFDLLYTKRGDNKWDAMVNLRV